MYKRGGANRRNGNSHSNNGYGKRGEENKVQNGTKREEYGNRSQNRKETPKQRKGFDPQKRQTQEQAKELQKKFQSSKEKNESKILRQNEKKADKELRSSGGREKVVTPASVKNIISTSATTTPNQTSFPFGWGGAAAESDHPANLVVDAGIYDLIRRYPQLLEKEFLSSPATRIGSVAIKLVCIWALFTFLRKRGKFYGTEAYKVADMPDDFPIPKFLARFLQYLNPIDYEGARFFFEYEYNTALSSTKADVVETTGIAVATGWKSPSQTNCVYNIPSNSDDDTAAEDAYILGSTVGLKTLLDVIDNSAAISRRLMETGCTVPFKSIPKYAPDHSAYASVTYLPTSTTSPYKNTYQAQCEWINENFDPNISAMFKAQDVFGHYPNNKISSPCPITKILDVSTDTTYQRGGIAGVINGFVFITNSMKDPYSHWNYCGHKLKTFVPKYQRVAHDSFAMAFLNTVNNLNKILTGMSASAMDYYTILQLLAACSGAYYYRISQFKPLCLDKNEARWLPAKVYSTIKLPPLIASIVENIGPNISDGVLVLPYPTNREFNAKWYTLNMDQYDCPDFWNLYGPQLSGAQNYSVHYRGLFLCLGLTLTSALTPIVGNQTIDQGWVTVYTTRPAFPQKSFEWVIGDLYSKFIKTNFSDIFVQPKYPAMGCSCMLATIQLFQEVFEQPIVLADDNPTGATMEWINWTAANRIDSIVPLGKKELVVVQMLGIVSQGAQTTGVSYSTKLPHTLDISSHSTDYMEAMDAVAYAAMQPGGSYVLALGEERAKVKDEVVQIGSLEVSVSSRAEECRSYWCKLFDTLLDAASEYIGGRGGEAYLMPNVVKQIEEHAHRYVSQYTGDLVGTAARLAVKGVGIMASTYLV